MTILQPRFALSRQAIGPFRRLFIPCFLIFVASLCVEALVIASALVLQALVDRLRTKPSPKVLIFLVGASALIAFLAIAIRAFRSLLLINIRKKVSIRAQSWLFRKLIGLPVSALSGHREGDLISRFQSLRAIESTFSSNAMELIVDGTMATVSLSLLFYYSYILALLTLCSASCYALIKNAYSKPLHKRKSYQIESEANRDSEFIDLIRGFIAIKQYGAERRSEEYWAKSLRRAVISQANFGTISIGFAMTSSLVAGVLNVAMIFWAGWLYIHSEFTAGMMLAFFSIRSHFSSKSNALADRLIALRLLKSHANRVRGLIGAENVSAGEGHRPQEFVGENNESVISAMNATFAYRDSRDFRLEVPTLEVKEGDIVVMQGPSGSGKTTLLKFLAGLRGENYDGLLVSGSISKFYGPKEKSAESVYIGREGSIYHATAIDNITLFSEGADAELLKHAYRSAQVGDVINSLPEKANTVIGGNKQELSDGERQRICIARAVYHKSKVLLLDEALDAIPVCQEAQILSSLSESGCTLIVSSHRNLRSSLGKHAKYYILECLEGYCRLLSESL